MLVELDETLIPRKRQSPPDDGHKSANDLLARLRKLSGMSQQEVAEVLGVERTSVTNMEAGRQMVHIKYLERFAAHLGLEMVISFRPAAAKPADGEV